MSQAPQFNAVFLHQEFVNGSHNTEASVDLRSLDDEELKAVTKFIKEILRQQEHEGRNKPSYVTSSGSRADDSSKYMDAGAWHYHSGPSYEGTSPPQEMTEWNLTMNLHGRHSLEVVHYSQKNVQPSPTVAITIFGFSRKHQPFPPSDFNKSHPHTQRMATLGNAINSGDVF